MPQQKLQIYRLKIKALLLIMSLLVVCGHELCADESPQEDATMAAARTFLETQAGSLGEDVVVAITPSSAQLPACEHPQPFLPFDHPVTAGNMTVGVKCGADEQQVRYMGAHISVMGRYLTTATFLMAGTTVESSALEEKYGDLSHLPDQVITSLEEAEGKATKLSLKPGTALLRYHLENPPSITRGESVLITTHGHGFKITRHGEALDSGGVGDTIRVRLPNRQTLSTRVAAPGVVNIATR